MSIERFYVTPITILSPGWLMNDWRQLVPDWDTATSVETFGWLTQLDSSEVLDGRDATVTHWKLFLPAGTEISSSDRVTANDETFEVDGEPHHSQTPSGEHHLEVTLRRAADIAVSP